MFFWDVKKGFGDWATIASKSEMVPSIENKFHYHIIVDFQHMCYSYHLFGCSWIVVHVWQSHSNIEETNHQDSIANCIISICERHWSSFVLIHTKQRNQLAYSRLQQLVFCYYNMKCKIHDMKVENDKVVEINYLDLLDILAKVGEEKDNKLFQ